MPEIIKSRLKFMTLDIRLAPTYNLGCVRWIILYTLPQTNKTMLTTNSAQHTTTAVAINCVCVCAWVRVRGCGWMGKDAA